MRNRNTPDNLRQPRALIFNQPIPAKRMQLNHLQAGARNRASIRHSTPALAALEEERVMFSLLFGTPVPRQAVRSVRQVRRRHRLESRKQRSKLVQTAVLFFSCALMTVSLWSLRRMQKIEHPMSVASRQFHAVHSDANETHMRVLNGTEADAKRVGGDMSLNETDATRARGANDSHQLPDETAESALARTRGTHAPTLGAVDASVGTGSARASTTRIPGIGARLGDGMGSGAGAGAGTSMERGTVGGIASAAYGDRNWTGADGVGLGLQAAGRAGSGVQMRSAVDASGFVGTGLGGGGQGGVEVQSGEGGDVIDSLDDEEGGNSPVITLPRNEMVVETSRESGVVGSHVGQDATKVGQIQVGLIERQVGNGTIDREEASGTVSTL